MQRILQPFGLDLRISQGFSLVVQSLSGIFTFSVRFFGLTIFLQANMT